MRGMMCFLHQPKVLEMIVPLVLVFVVNNESSRYEVFCVTPPNNVVFIGVTSSVLYSWIISRRDHEFIRSVFHTS